MNRLFAILILLCCFGRTQAQAPMPAKSSAEIQHMLKKLQVVGSVLYVAAHPDDENQRIIAYFDQGKGYRTAYLSLTRGDGGQNLIGDEKGPALGLLRTQELLAARRIDGGEQLFTRAYDFGYSKTPEETLTKWDKDIVLADVVWAIRTFRPDIIVTRFATPEKGGGGHGHHTASAMLAHQAFALAGDPTAFPEQLQHVTTWQPKRLFWNNYWVFRRHQPTAEELANIIQVPVGDYDPLLGKSYNEIASEARSMHRCQAFGSALTRGAFPEYLEYELGDPFENSDPMSGVETSWKRIGQAKAGELVAKAYQTFQPTQPQAVLPLLLEAKSMLMAVKGSDPLIRQKMQELDAVILACAGIWMEAISDQPLAAANDSLHVTIEALKRSNVPVELLDVLEDGNSVGIQATLQPNMAVQSWRFSVKKQLPVSQPYWLQNPDPQGVYDVGDQALLIGSAQNPSALGIRVLLSVQGTAVEATLPLMHRFVDRAVGELHRPVLIAPPLAINVGEPVYVFAGNQPKTIHLQAKGIAKGSYQLSFLVPQGWSVSPASMELTMDQDGQERPLSVTVTPPANYSEGDFRVEVQAEGMEPYSFGFEEISYDHIPTQVWFPPSKSRLLRMDIKRGGERIGYLMGSGDEIPASLQQIGYQVDILDPAVMSLDGLKQYGAVVAGIRAYNTVERMPYLQEMILKYVEQGGTYVVQYQTAGSMTEPNPGPYPLTVGRDRLTVEETELRMLQPDHQAFHFPNTITDKDFDGWKQERGLYYAGTWDERYVPLLAGKDPGENDLNGGLLVAPYGEGWYVYTGLAFFRQLPAGVPGAYRLFVNLLSLGEQPD